eukprot:scaffold14815_cov53-Phaeocystis_antarctica.AAC.2
MARALPEAPLAQSSSAAPHAPVASSVSSTAPPPLGTAAPSSSDSSAASASALSAASGEPANGRPYQPAPESSDEGEAQRSRLSFTYVAAVTPRREAIISSAAVRSAWPKAHSPPPERVTSTVVPPLPGPDSGVADATEAASTTTKPSPPPGSAKNCCAFRETSTVAAGSPATAGGEMHCSRLGASRHVAATLVSLPRREKRQVGAEPLPSPVPTRRAARLGVVDEGGDAGKLLPVESHHHAHGVGGRSAVRREGRRDAREALALAGLDPVRRGRLGGAEAAAEVGPRGRGSNEGGVRRRVVEEGDGDEGAAKQRTGEGEHGARLAVHRARRAAAGRRGERRCVVNKGERRAGEDGPDGERGIERCEREHGGGEQLQPGELDPDRAVAK